jgi:glycosyltransferase involved in cell wall biosynthesis
MKLILIGNYRLDQQESMHRFTVMLEKGMQDAGHEVLIWYPTVFFGLIAKSTVYGVGKWLGYIDKWILFSIVLKFKALVYGSKVRFHICDHSNSPYINSLPKKYTSITCHDVLAIRGAFGFKDAYCPASSMGKVLQNWILKNLIKVDKIAAVSQFTLDQLIDLNKGISKPGWKVIHNGFNAGFGRLDKLQWTEKLNAEGVPQLTTRPYILHVGSNLERKNKKMLLEMTVALGTAWDGLICFAGQPINDELRRIAGNLNLRERVIEIKKPSHKYLEALINGAQAFVFPSFSEGFGWPVIEAQACGTPVIASNLEPMPEVGGDGALYADPYSPAAFAKALNSIASGHGVEDLVDKGLENTKRFNTDLMNRKYLEMIFNK